jgi:NHL repeat-containing protein
LSFPTDVAVDDKDRIYVTERSTARGGVRARAVILYLRRDDRDDDRPAA